jgi:hypothetical protein
MEKQITVKFNGGREGEMPPQDMTSRGRPSETLTGF